MHVVTGGAYNGKSAWVSKYYQFDSTRSNWHWISAYDDACPGDLTMFERDIIILNGVEQWVCEWLKTRSIQDIRGFSNGILNNWLDWEQYKTGRKLVIIGTDISKGIVPMEKRIREWRDATGWFYQDMVAQCDRLDLVWYGVQQQLK